MPNQLRAIVLIWTCFLARGFFYSLAIPLWEGFDEYAHFAYVQHVAAGRLLAMPADRATLEVVRSMELVPMPWVLRAESPAHETQESYWRLPPGERTRRQRALAELAPSPAAPDNPGTLPSESQQPPLSYWLMAAIYQLVAGFSLPGRVFTLRLLNLVLTSVAVPAAWLAARRITGQTSRVPLMIAAIVALVPEMMFDGVRISNSALGITLYSALAVLGLEIVDGRRRGALQAGAVLGLGLLTKSLFLSALPWLVMLLIWAVWKRRLPWTFAAVSLALAAAIPGWWYLYNLRTTGTLTIAIQDTALRNITLAGRLRRIADVNWFTAIDSTFFSHIWFGGWSFLQVRAWMYHLFGWIAVLAVLGLALAFRRSHPARRYLAVLAGLYVLFCGSMAYHVLITFLANGVSSSAGWYLCAVIVPEVLLAAAGLHALAPAPLRPRVLGAFAVAFALLDVYGMIFVALPYYTGLIAHKPGGFLEAFHLSQLAAIGLPEFFRRLSVNRPALVVPVTAGISAGFYLLATATLAVAACRGRERRSVLQVR